MRAAREASRESACKQLLSPSGGMRLMLVLMAVPAVVLGALASLIVLAAALPMVALGVGRSRPALRWHGPRIAGRRALVTLLEPAVAKPTQRRYG